MRNYSFYAVVDDNGVCSVSHDAYKCLKAVFSSEEEAEQVVLKNKNVALKVVGISIFSINDGGNNESNGKA